MVMMTFIMGTKTIEGGNHETLEEIHIGNAMTDAMDMKEFANTITKGNAKAMGLDFPTDAAKVGAANTNNEGNHEADGAIAVRYPTHAKDVVV